MFSVFRSIAYPQFPEIDPKTHTHIPKYENIFAVGDELSAKFWVNTVAWPSRKPPMAEFSFIYDADNFESKTYPVVVNITEDMLKKGKPIYLSATVTHAASGKSVKAKGELVKKTPKPEVREKRMLLSGKVCPAPVEPSYGGKKTHIARGIPMMQVRLVFDETRYPYPWVHGPYTPNLFVDEFWMTNDQLVTLNATGNNTWRTEAQFGLMSAARWRFQRHMEQAFEQNAKMFGEDSEEMLQMRDLFANTNGYLLATTLIVSILHMVFEILAFKHDVAFWQNCDVDTLNKYMSVKSIVVGIFTQIVLLLYLWDESANILVLITSVASILIDVWKVTRAMQFAWTRVCGVPLPSLESKVVKEKADDFDSIAMQWLALLLSPAVLGYGVYTLWFDCHRGWYSYFLTFSASLVYSLGFVLMTPQIFINYKHKSVAYLPWKKFIYRALTTFIDDLFAMIIRMPTMHRLSCFRDDVVFIIYLYQRHCYPVDKNRLFDEDGYALSPEEVGLQEKED